MPSRSQFTVAIDHAPDDVRPQIAAQLGPLLEPDADACSGESTLFLTWLEPNAPMPNFEPGFGRIVVCSSAQFGRLTDAMVGGLVHGWIAPEAILPGLMRACVEAWKRFRSQQSPESDAPTIADEHEPGPDRHVLELMVQSMADGLIMAERHRDEVLINPAARALLEIPETSVVTRSYLQERLGFYPFDLVAEAPSSSELLREELSIGDKRLHSMVSPVREPGGPLLGVVVVLRDFTEAHNLAHRQEEFVAIVSHELRSPLTSIGGALDIALSDYAGRLNPK